MRTDDSVALGWFCARWQAARDDHYRFHDTAWMNPAAATAMADVDWSAIEALVLILNVPPP